MEENTAGVEIPLVSTCILDLSQSTLFKLHEKKNRKNCFAFLFLFCFLHVFTSEGWVIFFFLSLSVRQAPLLTPKTHCLFSIISGDVNITAFLFLFFFFKDFSFKCNKTKEKKKSGQHL